MNKKIIQVSGIMVLILSLAVFSATAPYPASPVISSITFDMSTVKTQASGSDNWVITWADDGHQYTSWGDGGGFGGSRVSFGVGRVTGTKDSYSGTNLWTGSGKSYGMLGVGSNLYMWRCGTASNNSAFTNQDLWISTNHGSNWTKTSVNFDNSGMFAITLCNFGKGYAGARDNYVYMYAPEVKNSGSWNVQKPGEISLLRVPKDQITQKSAYEFFAGLSNGNPTWTSSVSNRQPVFKDQINGVMRTAVNYNAGLKRYFLITQQVDRMQTGNGHIGIYDAPEPWGPWTTVLLANAWQVGINGKLQTGSKTVYWNFSNKWTSSDGKNFVLVYTGPGADNWGTVEGWFTLKVTDNTPPSTPGSLTAAALSENKIKLSWSASADAESGISHYIIKRGTGQIGTTAGLEFIDSGLTEGTQYSYTVIAVNNAMLESSPAGPVSKTTLADNTPPSLISVACSGDPTKVIVKFSEPMDKTSCEQVSNYSINSNIQVQSAVLQSDKMTVILTTNAHSVDITYTLTVINVKDGSAGANSIAVNSTEDYTYIAELIVTLVDYFGSATAPTVVKDGFVEGATQANDRSGSKWTGVPSVLSGLTYLLTARNDKQHTLGEDEPVYRVNASSACTVFVLVQANLPEPSWIALQSWTSTSLGVTADGSQYKVYKKYYQAGDIDLCAQVGAGSQGTGYVFKLASGSEPTVEAFPGSNKDMRLCLNVMPNPFNRVAVIAVNGDHKMKNANCRIYDVNGRTVQELSSVTAAGRIAWDAKDMAPGIYLVRLNTLQQSITRRILLVK
jgi:hypothetical protein